MDSVNYYQIRTTYFRLPLLLYSSQETHFKRISPLANLQGKRWPVFQPSLGSLSYSSTRP